MSDNSKKIRKLEYDILTVDTVKIYIEYQGVSHYTRKSNYFQQLVDYALINGLDEPWMYLPSDTMMFKPRLNSDEEKEKDIEKIKYMHKHQVEVVNINLDE